jgi:hypothetical protein
MGVDAGLDAIDLVIDASMRPQSSADDHWVTGDHFGLPIPADPAALHAGGAAFLTRAFRVSGTLTAGNAVTGISRFQEVPGGSTPKRRMSNCTKSPPRRQFRPLIFLRGMQNGGTEGPTATELPSYWTDVDILASVATRIAGLVARHIEPRRRAALAYILALRYCCALTSIPD